MRWVGAFLWGMSVLLSLVSPAHGQGVPSRGWTLNFERQVLLPCTAPEWAFSDGAGNTYLIRSGWDSRGGQIAKYDSLGREAWKAAQPGEIAAADCDLQGNLAVAYRSWEEPRGHIARYDPDGTLLWSAPWVEPQGLAEWGFIGSVEVMPDGVLAFGADEWDMVTAKYGPVGDGAEPIWVSRTMGEGDARDPLAVIDAGPMGSYSVEGPGGGWGCVLRNTSDGSLAWVIPLGIQATAASAAGPAPGGGLYVVGSGGEWINGRSVYFIVVLRIGPGGDILWERRYSPPDGAPCYPWATAWGEDGKVAVVGSAGEDLLTIILDPDGRIIWDARRPTLGLLMDWPEYPSVAFDADGSVYVGGNRREGSNGVGGVLIKYDPAGREAWSLGWGGTEKPATIRSVVGGLREESTIVLDLGRQSICSATPWDEDDLIRLDASGRQVWGTQYCRTWTDTFGVNDAGMDGGGNIYLAGGFNLVCHRSPGVTKVSPDGRVLWTHFPAITHPSESLSVHLAVDASGNATLATDASCGRGVGCIRVIRLDPEGREVWSADYGEMDLLSAPFGIAAAPDGGVWVTGGAGDPQHFSAGGHPVTIRYGPDGREIWASTLVGSPLMAPRSFYSGGQWHDTLWFRGFEGVTSLAFYGLDRKAYIYSLPPDQPWGWTSIEALATDGAAVFVAGNLPVPSWEPWRPLVGIRRYDRWSNWPQGSWTYELENHMISSDRSRGKCMAFYGGGNLVVAAIRSDPPGWTVVKLDRDGKLLWKSSLDLARTASIASMTVDAKDGVVVAGGLGTSGAAIAAWDAAGNVAWVDREEFPGGGVVPLAVLSDPSGNAYLVKTVIRDREHGAWGTEISQYLRLPGFVRGDANGDGGIDIADPIAVLFGLFAGSLLNCRDAADVDASDAIDVSDAIRLLAYLFFTDGPAPEPPFPGCGIEPDGLGCAFQAACP